MNYIIQKTDIEYNPKEAFLMWAPGKHTYWGPSDKAGRFENLDEAQATAADWNEYAITKGYDYRVRVIAAAPKADDEI